MEKPLTYMINLKQSVPIKGYQADHYCLEVRGLGEKPHLKDMSLRTIVALPLALDSIYGPREIHSNVDGYSTQLSLGYEVIEGLKPWVSDEGISIRAIRPIPQQG